MLPRGNIIGTWGISAKVCREKKLGYTFLGSRYFVFVLPGVGARLNGTYTNKEAPTQVVSSIDFAARLPGFRNYANY